MVDTVKLTSQSVGANPISGEELRAFDGKCVEKSGAIVQKVIEHASSLTDTSEQGSNMQAIAARMSERQLLLEELHGFLSPDGEKVAVESILNLMESFQKEHRTMIEKVFNSVLPPS